MTEETEGLAVLAVVDAYKWWLNSDFRLLQLTGILDHRGERTSSSVGKFDTTVMRQIARSYTVSRNIPSRDKDAQADNLVEILNESARELVLKPFKDRASALACLIRSNPVTVIVKGKTQQRQLASAYSKLTWFLQPDDWTIFDRYVGLAVCGGGAGGIDQMESFYAKLSTGWEETKSALAFASAVNGFHPLLGNRIIDKWLFLQGLSSSISGTKRKGMSIAAVAEVHQSLFATKLALGPHVGPQITKLAREADSILHKTNWAASSGN